MKAVLTWLLRRRRGQMPLTRFLVDVEAVPHQHVGCAELLVRGDEQLAVVSPGETAPAAALV
ncbi:hypothetical protein ADK77_36645 [Streptomyces antibioticus]|nr:hypothetical protein ADK77_36645 [Streptomyces antibioticus]